MALASASADGMVFIWDAIGGKCLETLRRSVGLGHPSGFSLVRSHWFTDFSSGTGYR